jgi:Methyltransferase domain
LQGKVGQLMMRNFLHALSRIAGWHSLNSSGELRDVSVIELDYPIRPRRRSYEATIGGKRITSILAGRTEQYLALLADIESFASDLQAIARSASVDQSAPQWENDWLPFLDSAVIYTLIRTLKPKTYFEVGSGHSTRFARRAVRDGHLDTRIVSVDPNPRAEINAICDEIIRERFEDIDASVYLDRLQPGDVVFIDNSHRSFQSSDVTVFFTEMLPSLPLGCTWGVHDICLPYDYPEAWVGRFYNEQYLLAAYLLGGHGSDDVIFPAVFAFHHELCRDFLEKRFRWPVLESLPLHGGAFWMRRK